MWNSNMWATFFTKRQTQQHKITFISTYVHPSACMNSENKNHTSRNEITVSLPAHYQ